MMTRRLSGGTPSKFGELACLLAVLVWLLAGCSGESSSRRDGVASASDQSGNGAAGSDAQSDDPPTTEAGPPRAGDACLRPADDASQVRFGPSAAIRGFLLGTGDRWVVLGHQSDGSSCQMLPLARQLAPSGYRVLALDFSGHGSSLPAKARQRVLADDLIDAVAYARAHGARSVALVGASMGGYASLGAALRLGDDVQAVVSLSAPSLYSDGGDTVNIRGLATPTLLYVGRDDISFVYPNRAFARQDPGAELHVLPTSSHGVNLVDAAVLRGIEEFLAQQL